MARRGENIYLRKDGRWEGRYIKGRKPDGKPKFGSVYGQQYQEVKRQLIMIKAELCQDNAALVIYGNGSLRDWADYWLEALIRPNIKLSTHAGYRRNLDKHILPHLGNCPIAQITKNDVQKTVDDLKAAMAPGTLLGICRLLKSLLTAAYKQGAIQTNPCDDIRTPKNKRRKPRVLSRLEQKKLEIAALESDSLEYLVCLYTGLRVGELCALKWEDIDFENSILYVNHTLQRLPAKNRRFKSALVIGAPKTDSSVRELPMPAFLSAALRHKRTQGKKDVFVFPGVQQAYSDPRTMQQRLSALCRKTGLHGVHMHTLRHSFATRCLEQKIGYEVLSELLGHSSPQITMKYYAHCTPQSKRESMERLKRIA